MSETKPATAIEKKEPTAGAIAAAAVSIQANGLVLRNMEDLIRFSRLIVKSGAAPAWAIDDKLPPDSDRFIEKAAGAVAIAVQAGLEHGLGLLGGLQAFVVLDGHISWKGEAAAAKIRNSGVCRPGTLDFWSEGDGENRKGIAVAHRVGDAQPARREFTYRDAKQAGLLTKFNWQKYPGRMFQWRALSWLARDKFSDVLGGFPLADEVQDFGEPAPMARVERTALPAPVSPDPLMAQLGVEAPAPATAVVEVEAQPVDAPFPSHAEADRALAAEDEQ